MRPPIALALALATAGLVACGGSESEAPQAPQLGPPDHPAKPGAANVVVVMTDDQDAASVRFMPTVQRALVAKGVEFTNAYATTPVCCPSRASFLTGKYAHNHGVRSNVPGKHGYDRFDERSTLPVELRKAGYATGFVGKYMNGYGWPAVGNSPTHVPPGWSRWVGLVNHTEYLMHGYDLNRDGGVKSYGDKAAEYQTDVLAANAERFVRNAAGRRPFFLTVAPVAPHDEPLEPSGSPLRNPRPPFRHLGRFDEAALPRSPAFNERAVGDKPVSVADRDRLTETEADELEDLYRSRLESLLAVDDLVGKVLRALAAQGELDETVVIFTSDNGFLLGEHRLKGKDVVYEEATRVPLAIRGPGFPRDETRGQLVANIDLAPTIMALAKAGPMPRADGESLLRVARDPAEGRDRAVLLEGLSGDKFAALRRGRWVYAEHETGERELYDLGTDPNQLRSLAGQPRLAAVERRLRAALARLRDCSGGGCRITSGGATGAGP